jgi:hypothetical protein
VWIVREQDPRQCGDISAIGITLRRSEIHGARRYVMKRGYVMKGPQQESGVSSSPDERSCAHSGGASYAMLSHRILGRASKDGWFGHAAILRDAAQERGFSKMNA